MHHPRHPSPRHPPSPVIPDLIRDPMESGNPAQPEVHKAAGVPDQVRDDGGG